MVVSKSTSLPTYLPTYPLQDIKSEADVLKVTEKFRLDLTDEEAARFFQELRCIT